MPALYRLKIETIVARTLSQKAALENDTRRYQVDLTYALCQRWSDIAETESAVYWAAPRSQLAYATGYLQPVDEAEQHQRLST